MRRGTNPLAVLLLIIIAIVSVIAAFFIKGILPDSLQKWDNFIFWGMIVALGGMGAVLVGKFMGRR